MNKVDRRKILMLGVMTPLLEAFADGKINNRSENKPKLAHIIGSGQSLGSGDDAFPLVTLKDTGYGNFQFSRGVHTWREQDTTYGQSPWLRPDSDFNLVPIVAGERATSTGETIASGLVDTLKTTIDKTIDTRFLFSFSGIGSKRLRDLDKDHDDTTDPRSGRQTPGGFYKTSIDDVRRAKAQADSRKWSYEVTALTWMQGEKNNDLRLSDWTTSLDRFSFLTAYSDDLIALKNEWNKDIKAITGQVKRISLFSYQTGAGKIEGTLISMFNTGQAQLLASDKDSEIYIVSPTYYMYSAENSINPFNGMWGNWIHLNGDSERWLGIQFAKVIKRVLVDGEKWKPLRPIKAWASSDRRTVYVQYTVPRKPIVIDNDFLPESPGAGLFIRGGPTVTAAAVYSPDTIALTLGSALPVEAFYVEYASEHGNSVALTMPSQILSSGAGAVWPNGQPSFEVVFQGNIQQQLAVILTRGVFYLMNDPNAPNFTTGTIRSVSLDANGNTVLRGEARELRNGVAFQAGQNTKVFLTFPYGNVRDSDPEVSIYRFASGPRFGQSYPLWNWSVGFQDLIISISN